MTATEMSQTTGSGEDNRTALAEFSAQAAQERFAEGSQRVKDYVVKQPARALGIALGLGVLVGWVIKRR